MNQNASSFSNLPLKESLFKNLASLKYKEMTPIQAMSLPIMLAQNDVIAQANTGSGKTVAFGLALLNKITVEWFAVQALVLCPTRELAEQVCQSLRQLARLMPNVKILNCSGGIPIRPQVESLRHSAHIIVGTPGRIQKHLSQETLKLHHVHTLVLDEADRMLDMGFFDDIKNIISSCSNQRQTLLFSATFPTQIKELAQQFMINPQELTIENTDKKFDIEQCFYAVNSKDDKYSLLKTLLLQHKPNSTLIFCNTKQQTMELTDRLLADGFSTIALNGDMEQIDRDLAMVRFVNQSCSILVATDVAARGLDIKELPVVINYDLAFDPEVHIHRIGRTGRAGNKGLAFSLVIPADGQRICNIEDIFGYKTTFYNSSELNVIDPKFPQPTMVTLILSAGKKDKIRPGDILGALVKDAGLAVEKIGKIDVKTMYSYVAIHQSEIDKAVQHMQVGKLKGRKVHVRKIV